MSTYRIVVGVDGTEGGRRALDWALHEAAARGGTVEAVTAWSWDGVEGTLVAPPPNPREQQRIAEQAMRDTVTQVTTVGPAVPVAEQVVEGRPAAVLTEAARGADLLVLGSHGHSRVRHIVLGSVSEECIRDATCPVVVLPTGQPHPPATEELVPRSAGTRS